MRKEGAPSVEIGHSMSLGGKVVAVMEQFNQVVGAVQQPRAACPQLRAAPKGINPEFTV